MPHRAHIRTFKRTHRDFSVIGLAKCRGRRWLVRRRLAFPSGRAIRPSATTGRFQWPPPQGRVATRRPTRNRDSRFHNSGCREFLPSALRVDVGHLGSVGRCKFISGNSSGTGIAIGRSYSVCRTRFAPGAGIRRTNGIESASHSVGVVAFNDYRLRHDQRKRGPRKRRAPGWSVGCKNPGSDNGISGGAAGSWRTAC